MHKDNTWIRAVPTKVLAKWDTKEWSSEGRYVVAHELKRRAKRKRNV